VLLGEQFCFYGTVLLSEQFCFYGTMKFQNTVQCTADTVPTRTLIKATDTSVDCETKKE
jgi:hypothetical protein